VKVGKNLLALFVILFLASGCSLYRALRFEYESGSKVHNAPDRVAQINRNKIGMVREGMSKEEFLNVMGTERMYLTGYWSYIDNPFKIETAQDINNQQLEIIYYFTFDSNGDKKVNPIRECTPFIFRQGKLIDWGNSAFDDLKLGKQ